MFIVADVSTAVIFAGIDDDQFADASYCLRRDVIQRRVALNHGAVFHDPIVTR